MQYLQEWFDVDIFHDSHKLITSTIWNMNGSYNSQILRCKNEQLRIFIVTFFYLKTRIFSELLIKVFCVSFKWPSLFHHTTIKIIFLHAYAFLLCYVNQGNAFNTTQQIYTSTMKSEWFDRESRKNS